MEKKRKIFFALVASAMVLNISYGIFNDGIPLPFIGSSIDQNLEGELISKIDVPSLSSGGIYRTSYNMTLDIVLSGGDDTESGKYSINGLTTRSIINDRILKDIAGKYQASYSLNETEDLSIKGDIERNTEMVFRGDGQPLDEKIDTLVSINGPKGLGSSSRITSTNSKVTSIRSDMIWETFLPFNGEVHEGHNGSTSMELNLQEAGLFAGDVVLVYTVGSIREGSDGRYVTISALAELGTSGLLDMKVEFKDGCPWPQDVNIAITGEFMTEEGPAYLNLRIRENLQEITIGSGPVLPQLPFDMMGPTSDPFSNYDGPVIPIEGGDTAYRSDPRLAFDHCLENGKLLGDLVGEYRTISLASVKYSRNDTIDRMWAWNVSVAAPPMDGISETVNFVVGVEGGGLIDKTRLSLISEKTGVIFRYPQPGRSMISLEENEQALMSSEMGDRFFKGDDHIPSYKLDILRRGAGHCDIGSALFANMLGFQKLQVKELYISTALDIKDPTIMYMVVVNGSDGTVISSTVIEGAALTLLKNYGFDIA